MDVLEQYLDEVCRSAEVRNSLRAYLLRIVERRLEAAKNAAGEAKEKRAQKRAAGDAAAGAARLARAVVGLEAGDDAQGPRVPSWDEVLAQVLRDFGSPAEKNQIELEQLEELTNAFLHFVDWIGRPLLPAEASDWFWILTEWDMPAIKAAILVKTEERRLHYHELMCGLAEVFHWKPAKPLRLERRKKTAVGEMHGGNFAKVSEPFSGVSVPRLTARGVEERIALIVTLGNQMAVVMQELALVRNKDRTAADQAVRAGKRMLKLGRGFAQKCQADPKVSAQPSMDELMENMRFLSELRNQPAPREMRK